jgi:bacterioferritin (cytochrome b1)
MTEGAEAGITSNSDLKERLMESLDMDPKKLAKLVDGMATDLTKNNVDAAVEKLDSMIDDNKEKADFLKMIVPNLDVSRDAEKKLKDKMKEYGRG